MDRYKKWRVSR